MARQTSQLPPTVQYSSGYVHCTGGREFLSLESGSLWRLTSELSEPRCRCQVSMSVRPASLPSLLRRLGHTRADGRAYTTDLAGRWCQPESQIMITKSSPTTILTTTVGRRCDLTLRDRTSEGAAADPGSQLSPSRPSLSGAIITLDWQSESLIRSPPDRLRHTYCALHRDC